MQCSMLNSQKLCKQIENLGSDIILALFNGFRLHLRFVNMRYEDWRLPVHSYSWNGWNINIFERLNIEKHKIFHAIGEVGNVNAKVLLWYLFGIILNNEIMCQAIFLWFSICFSFIVIVDSLCIRISLLSLTMSRTDNTPLLSSVRFL